MILRKKKNDDLSELQLEHIQTWNYYTVYPCFGLVIFINLISWIITGKILFKSLFLDLLLLGFSFSLIVFEMIADDFRDAKKKTKLRRQGYTVAVFGMIFLILHLVYRSVDIEGSTRIVMLILSFVLETFFVHLEYNWGREIVIKKAEKEMCDNA